jgi:hypothetical protein
MESHVGAFLYGEENVDRRGEGYDARRWPEGTFVLCGGKCTFGPLACHMSCCPWDASEHILRLRLAVSLVAPGQLIRKYQPVYWVKPDSLIRLLGPGNMSR